MTRLQRRQFLRLAASAAAMPVISRVTSAEAYPARPVRLLVGFAPGGGTDVMARLLQPALSARLGQQIVIENRPGAGTNIATEAVLDAAPDGYTLLAATLANAGNATLYDNLKFNFLRDSTPVAGIALDPFVLEVTPSLPVKTIPELIAYAKANPGKVNIGSGGIGSGNHLTAEMLKMMAGIDLVHVPYRGAGPAMVDLMGGQLQVMFNTMSASLQYVRAGKLRALGVATKNRQAALPDVATVAEFVPGYEASFWTGMAAPKGTSADIVDKLNNAVNAALEDPQVKARLAEGGAERVWSVSEKSGATGVSRTFPLEVREWFEHLRSPNGEPCCSYADGHRTGYDMRQGWQPRTSRICCTGKVACATPPAEQPRADPHSIDASARPDTGRMLRYRVSSHTQRSRRVAARHAMTRRLSLIPRTPSLVAH
jgi:tripartite-type tricarboxylate transporter receptor subunit TctC